MSKTKLRPASANWTGLAKLASFSADNNRPLPEVQACFLTARFRLDATRARVVAELVWGPST